MKIDYIGEQKDSCRYLQERRCHKGAAVISIRSSEQDAKTCKRAFTLRTKIALPNRQKSTSASE